MTSLRSCPRLRRDLVVRRIPGEDEASYVVKDPVSRKYLRFPEASGRLLAYLDGQTSLSDLQHRLRSEGAAAPSMGALESFVQQLRAMDLLELAPAERMEHQLEQMRTDRRLRARTRNTHGSLLHYRVSLWDPDRWMDRVVPRLGFFWTPAFLILSSIALLAAAGIIVAHWDRFASEFLALLLGRAGLPTYALLILVSIFVIAIHELGHGLTCKKLGGHVHEIGFLLMYFMPCFYCDVSDAWLFERRRERLWVTLAGAYIELFVGALATFVWWATEPGHPVNIIAFQMALISSLGAVVLNLNPLLKQDGYYALVDYLGLPNLRERAFQYLGGTVRRFLSGNAEAAAAPELSGRRRRILLTYGLLAGIYSVSVLVLFAHRMFDILVGNAGDWGVAGFLALAAGLIGLPLARKVAAFGRSGVGEDLLAAKTRRGRKREGDRKTHHGDTEERRDTEPAEIRPDFSTLRVSPCLRVSVVIRSCSPVRFLRVFAAKHRTAGASERPNAWLLFAGLLIALATIPRWSMPVRLRCVFEPDQGAVLYAPEDARVVQVLCAEGARVTAGQPLLRLQARELTADRARARLNLTLLRLRAREAQRAGDLAAWRAARRQVQAQEKVLARLDQRASGLTLSSPQAGTCLTARPEELLGRAVTRGTPLVTVGDTTRLVAVVKAEPHKTWDLREGATVLIRPHPLPGTTLRGRARTVTPAESDPEPDLRLTVPVANPGALRPGMTGSVKLYGPARSLFGHLREAALRLVRADLWG